VVGLAESVHDPGVTVLGDGLSNVDRRLERLDLAEEQGLVAVGVGPILQEA